MDVTVVVATFGGREWRELAQSRAIPSASATGAQVVHAHRDSLHEARNAGLELVTSEFVVHLDADDELDPRYLDAMSAGTADLRGPAVSYVRKYRPPRAPGVPKVAGHAHDCTADCLTAGNWLVIGTCARTDLLREVGGWRDWPCYEDWDLWLRCHQTGATVEAVPDAVYVAHVRPDSRNRAPSIAVKNRVHHEIVAANAQEAA